MVAAEGLQRTQATQKSETQEEDGRNEEKTGKKRQGMEVCNIAMAIGRLQDWETGTICVPGD